MPGGVGGAGDQVIAAGRLVAAAVTAQVHRDRAEARPGQGGQLVTPGPPEFGEAVQEQHQRPVAGLGGVEPGAVGGHAAMLPGAADLDHGIGAAGHRAHRVSRAAISGRCPSGDGTSGRRMPIPSDTVLRVSRRPDRWRILK